MALKRTGCDVVDNWNVRQAMSHQLFRVTTFCFNTCFQSFLILFGRIVHHAEVKFSPCRKAAVQQLLFVFFCHGYLTDLSTSSFRCSHFTLGNRKKSFLTLLFIYFRLFTLPQKKTSSNCCSAAFAVYLLLFSASDYLHSPSSASRARYGRSACIDMDMLRLVASEL